MITANEGGRHKAYAEMLGVDEYLRKPFAMDVLLEAVERIIGSAEERGSQGTAASRLKRSPTKRTPP
jgi:DNA-binding response OmpR family regulator